MNLIKRKYIVLSLALLVESTANGWAADHTVGQEESQMATGISVESMSVPCPPLTQIEECMRLQALGVVGPTLTQIHEGIRLHALPGGYLPTVDQINESLRLQAYGVACPTLPQMNEGLRQYALGIANPTPDQIDQALNS